MGFTAKFEDTEKDNREFTGRQRFSDIHRCEHKDGMVIVRASHSHQFGDRHNGVNMRDRIMTPDKAYRYVDIARGMAYKFMLNGEPTASAELTEIADDLQAKIREAIDWREKRNLSPGELAELLTWKQKYY